MELAKHWNSKVYNRVYNKVYNINDAIGTKLITRLSLGFRHLREHKFKLNFRDTLNTLCSCCMEVESTSHYFLCCCFFDALRTTLMNNLRNIDRDLPTLTDENLTNILLYIIRMTTKQIK